MSNRRSFSKSQETGIEGEILAYDELAARGYNPHWEPDFNAEGRDMYVGRLPVEVKFANPTYRSKMNRAGCAIHYPRWQFFIHDNSHKQEDWILILIAQDEDDQNFFFVLPGSTTNSRNHLQLTSHPKCYRGWLAQWLNRWEIIDYLANKTYANDGPLFNQLSQGQGVAA